jgi:hypothetical protein
VIIVAELKPGVKVVECIAELVVRIMAVVGAVKK